MIKVRLNVNSTTVRIHIHMHVHMHMALGRHVGLTNHQVGYSPRPELVIICGHLDSTPCYSLGMSVCLPACLTAAISNQSGSPTGGISGTLANPHDVKWRLHQRCRWVRHGSCRSCLSRIGRGWNGTANQACWARGLTGASRSWGRGCRQGGERWLWKHRPLTASSKSLSQRGSRRPG